MRFLAAIAAALFLALRWPLLHGNGVIDGTNVDTSILALMGRKMFEGGGFDVFAWGVRHLGSLTSILTAAWAWPLSMLDVPWLWPRAVRLAAMTEVAAGIVLIAYAVARIDRRAAGATALILVLGPPELFRMSVYALGHEMAFFLGGVIVAMAAQHLTAPEGRGWLATPGRRFLFGLVAGIGWWMNKTVAFAIGGVLIVMVLRSRLFERLRTERILLDRLLLRPHKLPGMIEAAAFVFWWSGLALLAYYLVCTLFDLPTLNFILGNVADGVALAVLGQAIVLLPSLRGAWRPSREVLAFAQALAGWALGYLPAWLVDRYNWEWLAGGSVQRYRPPSLLAEEVATHGRYVVTSFLGVNDTPAGILYALALLALAVSMLIHYRRDVARYLRLTPSQWGVRTLFASVLVATLIALLVIRDSLRSRYLLATLGPLVALLALEGVRWWDSRRLAARAAASLAFGACLISIATGSLYSREVLYVKPEPLSALHMKPDPLLVLARVDTLGCRVCYTNYYQAYDYRLLSDERVAFLPYTGGVDLTPSDTRAAQQLPGQRCYITLEGSVFPLKGDLMVTRYGKPAPTREALANRSATLFYR